MDGAVLSRILKAPKHVTGMDIVDKPIKYQTDAVKYLESEFDHWFDAFILVVVRVGSVLLLLL
jgi:hypothetical protein